MSQLRNADWPYAMEDPYELGYVDWEKYADNFGLSPVPFENEDPSLVYAEDSVGLDDEFKDELLLENLFSDGYDELAQKYTVAVFDPPANMSEDAKKICDSIKWSWADHDVDRLKALGVEPIETFNVSCVYIDDPLVYVHITFDGDANRIQDEIAGKTVGGDGSHDPALYVEGKKMRPNDYLDAVADKHGGQFAVFLERIAAGVPFTTRRETEDASVYF